MDLKNLSFRRSKSYFLNTIIAAATAAKSLQSCPTLCDPIDGRPSGSPVPGILQARTLEWVAISFSSAWKSKVKVKLLSRVRLLATLWTAAHQAPPSMGLSRQEYWSGVPLPSPFWLLLWWKILFPFLKAWGMGSNTFKSRVGYRKHERICCFFFCCYFVPQFDKSLFEETHTLS